jgi:hypothetical protein
VVEQRTPKNAPPVLKSGFPVLGNFIGFAKAPVGFVREAHKKVGGALRAVASAATASLPSTAQHDTSCCGDAACVLPHLV